MKEMGSIDQLGMSFPARGSLEQSKPVFSNNF